VALSLLQGGIARAVIEKQPPTEPIHEHLGRQLYSATLSGTVGEAWKDRRKKARRRPLHLVIRVDPESAAGLLDLPWEYLHNGQCFLALDRRTPFSRLPWGVEPEHLEPLEGGLRMLVVISAPQGLSEEQVLDTAREEDLILEANRDAHRTGKLEEVVFAPNGSLEALQEYLAA
jgi:hypothetical protein